MDLRHAQVPVMCGHYIGDPIAGAERALDAVVDQALTRREHLGIYAGAIGTSALVLNARSPEELKRGTGNGALIVGLGQYSSLSAREITATVRAGVLRLLLRAREMPEQDAPKGLKLASVLIGHNSTTNIATQDSVDAIVLGVCEANRQAAGSSRSGGAAQDEPHVAELEFVEIFLETAISAAHRLRGLPERMKNELSRLDVRVGVDDTLIQGEGVRRRLQAERTMGYWPRLLVTDGTTPDAGADAAGGDERCRCRKTSAEPSRQKRVPDKIKYLFLSARSRAEQTVDDQQPEVIEGLIRSQIASSTFNRDLSQALFQLLLPLEFKAAARGTDRIVLVVDETTANLPWEMLVVDGQPLVLNTRVVRQLVTGDHRREVRAAPRALACVIGEPSTDRFYDHFEGSPPQQREGGGLPELRGAVEEAEAIAARLRDFGYEVEPAIQRSGQDTLLSLMREPYRILTIAAHGVVGAQRKCDGAHRTGVVLSDGMLITANIIGRLEIVPELVFLNCCHLGQMDNAHGELAAGVAQELIKAGVRCVVAAGWQVNDAAAQRFAEDFFDAFVRRNEPFGRAVWDARRRNYQRFPNMNTWGAYQAYGDPEYVLEPGRAPSRSESAWSPVSPLELIDRLQGTKRNSLEALVQRIDDLLSGTPGSWRNLPDVQAAIGKIYADHGPAGYEQAIEAYVRALSADDHRTGVRVDIVEQLANLEARHGAAIGGDAGVRQVRSAVARMERLLEATSSSPADRRRRPDNGTPERWSILASARKREAVLLARDIVQQGPTASSKSGRRKGSRTAAQRALRELLQRSRADYASACTTADRDDFDPYPLINKLQLDGVLGEVADTDKAKFLEQVEACRRLARERFRASYDFFDAASSADAEVARMLIEGDLAKHRKKLAEVYRDAVGMVPSNARTMGSVRAQLAVLATLIRGLGGVKANAEALEWVGEQLTKL